MALKTVDTNPLESQQPAYTALGEPIPQAAATTQAQPAPSSVAPEKAAGNASHDYSADTATASAQTPSNNSLRTAAGGQGIYTTGAPAPKTTQMTFAEPVPVSSVSWLQKMAQEAKDAGVGGASALMALVNLVIRIIRALIMMMGGTVQSPQAQAEAATQEPSAQDADPQADKTAQGVSLQGPNTSGFVMLKGLDHEKLKGAKEQFQESIREVESLITGFIKYVQTHGEREPDRINHDVLSMFATHVFDELGKKLSNYQQQREVLNSQMHGLVLGVAANTGLKVSVVEDTLLNFSPDAPPPVFDAMSADDKQLLTQIAQDKKILDAKENTTSKVLGATIKSFNSILNEPGQLELSKLLEQYGFEPQFTDAEKAEIQSRVQQAMTPANIQAVVQNGASNDPTFNQLQQQVRGQNAPIDISQLTAEEHDAVLAVAEKQIKNEMSQKKPMRHSLGNPAHANVMYDSEAMEQGEDLHQETYSRPRG